MLAHLAGRTRCVVSGSDDRTEILKSAGRWITLPPEYGSRNTLYDRYVHRAAKAYSSTSGGRGGALGSSTIRAGTLPFVLMGGKVADCVAGAAVPAAA